MTLPPLFSDRFAKRALVSVLALSAGMATAQEDNRILLRSLDGAMSLEGSFIGFRDGVYVLDHASLGTLRIEGSDQIICEGAACPGNEPEPVVEAEPEAAPEPEAPVVVEAPISRTIELSTSDGRLSIEGDFVEISNDAFIIDSPTLGRLSIAIIPGLECSGEACPELAPPNSEKLIAGTSREVSQLLPLLLDGYAAATGATVEVGDANEEGQVPVSLIGGNGVEAEFLIATRNPNIALSTLADRTASLVLSDRRIGDLDVASNGIPDLRGSNQEQKIALDGLVLATNTSNPVRSLSAAEIAGIWSGEIANWLTLGGGDLGTSAISALDSDSDVASFNQQILAPNGSDGSAATDIGSPANLIAALQADPGAIGLVRRSEVVGNGLKLINIRETCGLLSSPSEFEIKNGGYVLGKSVYSYFAPEFASPELANFAAWIGSSAANAIVEQNNYVNAVPGRMALQDMGLSLIHTAAVEPDFSGEQFSSVMQELRNAERSSSTFRFEPSSANLDPDSVKAITQLAEQISAGVFEGFEVLLVGFSDSSGPAAVNTDLALERATQVQEQLTAVLGEGAATNLTTLSAGELLPMSCNTTEAGRERNRRVETWIRLN